MTTASHPSSSRSRPGGLAAYVLVWMLAGGAAVGAVVAVLSAGDDPPARRAAVPAAAPPVREVELGQAMRAAGCDVRRASGRPISVAGAAAAPGVYRRPITADERRRAVRAGVVVVEYRGGTDAPTLARLVSVQRAAPTGTVLAPSATLRADALSVSTFGRQLRCPQITPRTFDALQLFRGRYLGSGPGH